MKRLPRYSTLDAYTMEEVRREFEASDATGRIRLLRKLYRETERLPYEFALRVVEDPNPQVRAWFARNGVDLDYRERRRVGGGDDESHVQAWETIDSHPKRNLELRLGIDPDPFVRACSFENPSNMTVRFRFEEQFQVSSHFERLALVRNQMAPRDFVEKLFDYDDRTLVINTEERRELILAYLSNESFAEIMTATSPSWRLWELAPKWPAESGIQHAVYACVDADDSTRAQAYQACEKPSLRRAILSGCGYQDTETLSLGSKDSDAMNSLIAVTMISKSKEKTLVDKEKEFREEVRGELQRILRTLDRLRGWMIAIGVGVFFMVLTYISSRLLR